MSDKRISQLVERVTIANNDVLPIVALNAATTNKVTISTIQDWMQTNLNMGVTSVAITLPTGLSVTGSPITSTGTFAISFTAGYSIPTTAKQTEWDTAYTNRITSATAPLGIASNVISITQSGTASNGYLSSTDWNTFNNKQSTITTGNLTEATSSVLTITGGTGAVLGSGTSIEVKQASGSQDGFLDSADWTTFNNKQNALSGTGIVKSTGGTISYLTDSTSNWDSAYNDKINSAAVTGTTTKTLTLTQQDGGTIVATWTDDNTDAVSSVFGRTGAVVAVSGDYNTSQVTENTNLYFTDTRARGAISLTTTGTTGVATYNSSTGVINIPNYTPDLSGFVPYTGATTNVNLGIHSLTAADLVVNHASGSGVAASITKGGNGEALTVFKTSGSGNAASITGGVTLLSELHLTTDLADSYIASATNWNAAYNDKINSAAVTGTTTKTLTLTQQDGGTITASWTDINTDAVSSVFGRTGAVVATSGDYNTDQVTEGLSSLYFTNARSRSSISLTTTGTSGAATYNSSTGVLNIPSYIGGVTSVNTLTGAVVLTTNEIAENVNNLYFTNTRARAAISLTTTGTSGAATYSGGVLNIPNYSTDLSGYVTIGTAQTITGAKTFSNVVKINYDGGTSVESVLRLRGSNATARTTRLQFEDYSGALADGIIDFKIPTLGTASSAVLSMGVNGATLSMNHAGSSFFSGRLNINGAADDGDVATTIVASSGAGKYTLVGRDSSQVWNFSVASDGYTRIGYNQSGATYKLLTLSSNGNDLDTGTVLRLIGNNALDLLDISTRDTMSRIYHQENSVDAANGYGLIQFRTNAVGQSSFPLRGGFKFTTADGDALVITNERKATFNSDVTFSGNVTFGNYIISDTTFADGYKLMLRNPSLSIDALKGSYFGYSSGYGVLIVGHTGANNRSLAFGVDVSSNPSGAFSGWGSEYIWRGAASFITPNATNNGYNTLLSWNTSGVVTINNLIATSLTLGNTIQIGDYTGNPVLTFAAVNGGINRINFYDQNTTEGLYLRTDAELYGGTMTFGARWDDDEAKIVFKMYQVSAGGTYNARVGIGTGAINPLSMLHVCELDGGNYLGSLRVGGSSGFGIVMDYTQSAYTTATMYASPTYSSADVLFKLGAGSGNTNQLVLKGNGRIGIGGVSPLGILDVYRAAGGSGTSAIVISNGEVNGRNWALSTEVVTGGDFAILSSTTAGGIPAPSGANTKLYILAGGNIGMGTTTVPGRLTAKYSSYSSGQTPLYIGNTGFTNWSRQAYDTFVLQQDDVTSFRMVEKNGEDTTSDQVLSFSIGDGSAVIASSAQPMKFYTNGSPSGLAYQGLSGTLSMTLQTNGNALFGYSITASGDIIAFSDIRYKENIRPIENALDRITKSRGVLYDRKNGGNKNNIGFIAQELELQFPELISVNADGTLGVKYQNAVAVLFEAMKEQQKQIEELKKQVA